MDQSHDGSGREYFRITRLYPTPGFVKDASDVDLRGNASLPADAYGDPRRLIYPCHTPASTWTSYAFFLDKKASVRPSDAQMIEERIMHCGRIHGIAKTLEALKEAVAKNVPAGEEALPDDDFALVYEHAGEKKRRYPMRNALETKAAAAYLFQYRDDLPFEARQSIADKVLQKQAAYGATFGVELNEYIEKQAGHGACAAKEAVDLIKGRVAASRRGPGPNTPLQDEMLKLASIIEIHPSRLREPGMRTQLASTLDQFDVKEGLKGQYGPGFPRVEDVLFGVTGRKMAACVREHCATVTGNMYKLADLERIRLGEVRDYFGPDFAQRMTSDGLHVDSEKAGQFIQTLPRGDVVTLERFMDGLGIKPIAKEASAQAVGFSTLHLRQLAEERQRAVTAAK